MLSLESFIIRLPCKTFWKKQTVFTICTWDRHKNTLASVRDSIFIGKLQPGSWSMNSWIFGELDNEVIRNLFPSSPSERCSTPRSWLTVRTGTWVSSWTRSSGWWGPPTAAWPSPCPAPPWPWSSPWCHTPPPTQTCHITRFIVSMMYWLYV